MVCPPLAAGCKVQQNVPKVDILNLKKVLRPSSFISLDGKIILRRIFRKWDVGVWNGSSWLRIRTGGGHL
jgi:hypothetical protein